MIYVVNDTLANGYQILEFFEVAGGKALEIAKRADYPRKGYASPDASHGGRERKAFKRNGVTKIETRTGARVATPWDGKAVAFDALED